MLPHADEYSNHDCDTDRQVVERFRDSSTAIRSAKGECVMGLGR